MLGCEGGVMSYSEVGMQDEQGKLLGYGMTEGCFNGERGKSRLSNGGSVSFGPLLRIRVREGGK